MARVPIRMRSAVASIGSVTFDPSFPFANVHRNARLLIRVRRSQRHRLRDDAAHRMAGDMEAVETERIDDRKSVGRHVVDGQPSIAADAPPIPRLSNDTMANRSLSSST